MIADTEIPGADPAAVVEQFRPYVMKLARRYIPVLERTGAVGLDDLYQVGFIAVLNAQKNYDPEQGTFLHCLFYCVRNAMRKALGFDCRTGAPPVALDYLDEKITGEDGSEIARIDLVADDSILPFDEPLIEDENRRETALEVRAALNRLKSERQREIVQRIHFAGEGRKVIAADMGITASGLGQQEHVAYRKLRADSRLRRFAETMPFFHVSVSQYATTWTSATERAVLWRDEHLPKRSNESNGWKP